MAAVTRTPTKKRRSEETRRRLLDAALSGFARHGYERATVDEIVRAAGYSKGAFYVHFDSKEDLFWSMLGERLERQQQAFRQALDPDAPVAQNLRTILSGVFALQDEDPLWGAMFSEFAAHAARNEKARDKLAAMYNSWRNFAVEALRFGQEAGSVRSDIDVEFIASLLIAVVEGAIMQSRVAPESLRLDQFIDPLSHLLGDWLEDRAGPA